MAVAFASPVFLRFRRRDERRLANLVRRCAWCRCIDTGTEWLHDRRHRESERVTDGICPACWDALEAQTARSRGLGSARAA